MGLEGIIESMIRSSTRFFFRFPCRDSPEALQVNFNRLHLAQGIVRSHLHFALQQPSQGRGDFILCPLGLVVGDCELCTGARCEFNFCNRRSEDRLLGNLASQIFEHKGPVYSAEEVLSTKHTRTPI